MNYGVLRSDKFIVKRCKISLREMKGSSAAIGEKGMCYARSLETYKNELCSNYMPIYRAMEAHRPF